jgi:SAM-dependent methyltransferase
MIGFMRKVIRQIRIDGVFGVIAKVPIWLRTRSEQRLDRRFGIATMGQVEVDESAGAESGLPHLANAVFYAPLRFDKFNRLMRAAQPFDPAQYTFIDFGAGKGRALALAVDMGFHRVIGVELFESLCAQARDNIAALALRDPRAADIELLCLDAAAYRPPPGNLFCYFYNPFDDVVMRKVLANIEAACASESRRLILAYSNPQHAEVFDAMPFLQPHYRSDVMCVYVGRRDQGDAQACAGDARG